MHRYTNIRTGETIEFPDPQPSFAQHEEWRVEHAVDQVDEQPSDEDLDALKREDLDKLALELGVEDPDKLPNKGAVIEAIEARRSES
jgi:hypothetical protein